MRSRAALGAALAAGLVLAHPAGGEAGPEGGAAGGGAVSTGGWTDGADVVGAGAAMVSVSPAARHTAVRPGEDVHTRTL